jgi:hypothetical protein
MPTQFIRRGTRLQPGPISVRRNRAFLPASLPGLDELENRVVLSVTLSVTAAPFYADSSGVNDSSAAIQNCINAVHAAGGGTVFFPAGTYKISFAGAGRATSDSMFTVPSNITFAGSGQNSTKLLMAPNQGDYRYIFDCQADNASNVIFQDLTIDQNGLNAGGSLPSPSNVRTVIIFTNGTDNFVQRCHFTNIVGVWTIAMFGQASSVTIENNTFDNVGLNTTNIADIYDHSTLYTDAANITITGNTFTGRLVNGTTVGAMGATTAIEIHGYNQSITNNTVSNYSFGSNVASSGEGYPNSNQLYQTNTFTNVGTAFVLWPNGTLSNCSILNNIITVDVLAWYNYWGNQLGCGGIAENPAGIGPTNSLTISGNTVNFTNFSTALPPYPADCNGILCWFTVNWNSRRLGTSEGPEHPVWISRRPAARVCRVRANPGASPNLLRAQDRTDVVPRSRLRSWPLGRRSGCSPAEPYPPPRPSSIIVPRRCSRNLPSLPPRAATYLTSRLQLAVPFGEDLPIQSRKLVHRCHISQRAMQTHCVVVPHIG